MTHPASFTDKPNAVGDFECSTCGGALDFDGTDERGNYAYACFNMHCPGSFRYEPPEEGFEDA